MRILTILISLILIINGAMAGGFKLYLMGQRQLGMGVASTALAQDASAGYFNPGALVFTPHRANLLFGGTAIRPITQYAGLPPSAYVTAMDTVVITPIYLYGSWKGKKDTPLGRWALGFSLTNPFGSTTRWPDDWKGKYLTQEFAINTLALQSTLSFKVTPKLGIGLGFRYLAGTLLGRKALPNTSSNGADGNAQYSGTGAAWGLSLGMYAALSDKVNLGITYRSRMSIPLDSGIIRFTVPPSLTSQYPDQSFYSEIPLPSELNLGLSYRPQERLLLSFEVQWVGWQVFDSLHIYLQEEVPGFTTYPERAFKNTVNFRLGGEYSLSTNTMIRAGGYFKNSPVPQLYVSPELPDANSIGITAGFSWRIIRNLTLDLAYVYEYTGERTSSFSAGGFGGIYRSTQSNLGIGLGYVF